MEMQTVLMVVMICAVVALGIIILIKKQETGPELLIDLRNRVEELKTKQLEANTTALADQQKNLGNLINTVNQVLSASQQNIVSQLGTAGKTINEIHQKLGVLEETARGIQEVGKDIASLEDILKAPKVRGGMGELMLEELLKQVFPAKSYQMKYSFRNGKQVDAVIFLGDGIVPIDSKFPLESFRRLVAATDEKEQKANRAAFVKSVKDRIDEIADRYINPDEIKYDFALMYIPAENVFYETIINDSFTGKEYEIFKYAISRHVIPVSPNSFYAYLMAIAYGLKGFQIERQAKEIISDLGRIQTDFSKFFTDYEKVGKHLKYASSCYDDSRRKADRIYDHVGQVTGIRDELPESPEVEKNLDKR